MTASEKKLSLGQTFRGIFTNKCPRCLKGYVFSGIYSMNRECQSCHLLFEKEPGYFLGAVIAAYFIGSFSLVPTLIISVFLFNIEMPVIVGMGTLQILFLHPFFI